MLRGGLLGDGQSQTEAAAFAGWIGPVEGLEDGFAIGRIKGRPGVFHRELAPASAAARQAYFDLSSFDYSKKNGLWTRRPIGKKTLWQRETDAHFFRQVS